MIEDLVDAFIYQWADAIVLGVQVDKFHFEATLLDIYETKYVHVYRANKALIRPLKLREFAW